MDDSANKWEDGFMAGLELGFATAEVIVRDGGGVKELRHERGKIKAYQAKQRGVGSGRGAVEGDIYEPQPVAHPADFGMPWTPSDAKLSAASRLRPA